jgi:hypothetical protein
MLPKLPPFFASYCPNLIKHCISGNRKQVTAVMKLKPSRSRTIMRIRKERRVTIYEGYML